MNVATVILAVALVAVLVALGIRESSRRKKPVAGSSSRILFPFIASGLSERGLDAALRIARNEGGTLVPALLARVPMRLPIDAALPRQSASAMPLLEVIEQRATRAGVAVDARIERGRTLRHALAELTRHEQFDALVVAAVDATDAGFHPNDIGWILENVEGEIIVIRSGGRLGFAPLPGHVRWARRRIHTPKR
jgi:hypothetical protein